MTKTELSRSLAIAQAGNAGFPTDNIFDGFGLYEFQPVYCTVEQVAQLRDGEPGVAQLDELPGEQPDAREPGRAGSADPVVE